MRVVKPLPPENEKLALFNFKKQDWPFIARLLTNCKSLHIDRQHFDCCAIYWRTFSIGSKTPLLVRCCWS